MLRILVVGWIAIYISFLSVCAYADIEISEVTVTDVTPSSFIVNWHSSSASTPNIEVYDSSTLENNITTNYESKFFLLGGGSADFATGQQPEVGSSSAVGGLSRVQVRGLSPDTDYFFRVSSSSETDTSWWPLFGAELVATESENSFTHYATQLVVDVNEEGAEDWVVQASVEGGKYPISSIVGDGAGLGKAVLNLSNIFTASNANWDSSANISPVISVLKNNGEVSSELFENIVLGSEFSVATNVMVVLDDRSLPLPPEIDVLDSVSGYEGGIVEFPVVVTDPNETIPSLTVDAVPLGADFNYSESGEAAGQGVFRWIPQVGQQGDYVVTLIAHDGELDTKASVSIKINPASDKDGDGLQDDWEVAYFGDLSQSGEGDFDSDGYSNIEEFENGWNPSLVTQIPSAPVIHSPIFDAEVDTQSPVLKVVNSSHSEDIDVDYLFEVYSDQSMNEKVFSSQVVEGTYTTSVVVNEVIQGGELLENAMYYWRVRGISSAGGREWVAGQFFLNADNDLPTIPEIRFPAMGSSVSSLVPTLSVNNSIDFDRDELKYNFNLYLLGSDLNSPPLYSISELMSGHDGYTAWRVPEALEEDTEYIWYAEAVDEHGAVSRSDVFSFFVSSINDSPSKPVITYPSETEEVDVLRPIFSWGRVIDPEGANVEYVLQINTDESFDSSTNMSFTVPQGHEEFVRWTSEEILEDNTVYYWRVSSHDGLLSSDWSDSSFFLNTQNDVPTSPTVANPALGSVVEVLQPLMVINPSQDLDHDALKYRFQLYSDEELMDLVVEASVDDTQWQVAEVLSDNSFYYWRVRAEDEHGAVSDWSQIHSFFVNDKGVNDPPYFQFILPSSEVELIDGEVLIQWMDSDPDSNAQISLWYENSEGEELLIDENISEDLNGDADQFLWHISDLEVGEYRVKAIIADEQSSLTVLGSHLIKIIPAVGVIQTSLITGNTIDEYGARSVQVDVTLDREPVLDSNVSVNVRVSDESEAVIKKVTQGNKIKPNNYLYFTQDNWDKPISIFVSGIDDCEIDGSQPVDLIFENVSSDDSGFDGVDPADIVLSNLDNEVEAQTLFICSYVKLGREVSADGTFVYTSYKAQLKNTGGDRLSPSGVLTVLDEEIEVVGDNAVTFPNISSGDTVNSVETFTVNSKVGNKINPALFQWEIKSDPPQADLSVQLEGRDGKWSNGVFKFASVVKNEGPSMSSGVELRVTIPKDVSIFSIEGSECIVTQTEIVCSLGDINVNDSKEILITIESDEAKTKYDFSASVSSLVNDSDKGNNSNDGEFGGAFSLLWLFVLMLIMAYGRHSLFNRETA